MADIINSVYKMRYMDEISLSQSPIHKLHPITKILVTLVYLIVVVSLGKYDFLSLLPLVLYPIVIFSLSDTPYGAILKRALYVSPLIIGVGIFNPIFDTQLVTLFDNIKLSLGWISFFVLVLKSFLCVMGALLLLATTGIEKVASGLWQLKVPKIFVMQLTLTYRYIMVLAEEAARLFTAYSLRAPGHKGVHLKVYGSLAGQLLLRTFSKAERVYIAMKLRGFDGEYPNTKNLSLKINDLIYIFLWCSFLIFARYVNLPIFIGNIFTSIF